MGGSGGGWFHGNKADDLINWIRNSQGQSNQASYDTKVSGALNDLLARYNDRDVDLITNRIQDLKQILEDETETSVDLLFGGSVAKHTYVDGLSDIDALVILKDPKLAQSAPGEVLDYFQSLLMKKNRPISR